MKFTVDRDVLVGKLATTSQTIGKGAALKTNPALSGFFFSIGSDGEGSVLTTNNQQFTKAKFALTKDGSDDTETFLVEGDRFQNILTLMDSGDLDINVTNNNVQVSNPATGEQYAFPRIETADFPNIDQWIDNADDKGEIDVAALVRSLDFLKPSISNNENMPIYTFAEYDPDMNLFKATTGIVLAFYKSALATSLRIKIWGSSIPPLLGFVKGMDKVSLSETDNHCIFQRDGDVFGFTKVTHNFRSAKVKPDDFSEPDKFVISRKTLLPDLQKLGQVIDLNKDKFIRFTIAGEGDSATLTGRVIGTTGAESRGKSIGIDRNKVDSNVDDSYEIPVTYTELLSTLNSFDTDSISVYIQPGKWVKLVSTTDNGEEAIAMVA